MWQVEGFDAYTASPAHPLSVEATEEHNTFRIKSKVPAAAVCLLQTHAPVVAADCGSVAVAQDVGCHHVLTATSAGSGAEQVTGKGAR